MQPCHRFNVKRKNQCYAKTACEQLKMGQFGPLGVSGNKKISSVPTLCGWCSLDLDNGKIYQKREASYLEVNHKNERKTGGFGRNQNDVSQE